MKLLRRLGNFLWGNEHRSLRTLGCSFVLMTISIYVVLSDHMSMLPAVGIPGRMALPAAITVAALITIVITVVVIGLDNRGRA